MRAGSLHRAMLAGLIGGFIGILLVADPSLGWGVHGLHPSIALLPSAIGSFWGGYYLWNFYDAVPRGLRGVPLRGASRIALSDPAMSIFVGGIARLLGATLVLSAIVIGVGHWTHGTDAASVFVAFGLVGLLCLLVGLLEAFSLYRAALIATAAGLGHRAHVAERDASDRSRRSARGGRGGRCNAQPSGAAHPVGEIRRGARHDAMDPIADEFQQVQGVERYLHEVTHMPSCARRSKW